MLGTPLEPVKLDFQEALGRLVDLGWIVLQEVRQGLLCFHFLLVLGQFAWVKLAKVVKYLSYT